MHRLQQYVESWAEILKNLYNMIFMASEIWGNIYQKGHKRIVSN